MTDIAVLIAQQVERLRSDFNLYPITASELEFYLIGSKEEALPSFWQEVEKACIRQDIGIYKTEKETGIGQFEIALTPYDNPAKTARDTQTLKTIIADAARVHAMEANFSAKPFADQPGSGLHIHVHLADQQGKNIFYKDNATIRAPLQHSIGGLLAWLNACMIVFAPNVQSYARFAVKSNGPQTLSWGANNRTVAIRLPDSERDNKRIEHRVAGADADPELVIAVILAAMHYGMKNNCDPGRQIYGDAALPMYALPPIIRTRNEAIDILQKTTLLDGYFSVSDLLPNQP